MRCASKSLELKSALWDCLGLLIPKRLNAGVLRELGYEGRVFISILPKLAGSSAPESGLWVF